MNQYRPFTRLGLLALALLLAFASLLATPARPSAAADADTFYLSWPYEPPPKGNLNIFSPDALTNGGFGPWSYLLQPTMGYFIGATGKYEGWLAEKWGFSDDGKKYTITLAKDLTWSDGSPITSKDVIGTFNLFRVTSSAVYTNGVAKVVAVDDHTVDYLLEKPPGIVLQRSIMKEIVVSHVEYGALMDKAGALLDAGEKAGKKLADIKAGDDWKALEKELADFRPTATISSGPYTLDLKDVQTAQLVMRRTDKTKFGKLAKFDKVVVYKGDTEVTTPLILSGDLYYATDYFPPPVEKSFTDKGIQILRAPSLGGPAVFFNFAVAPLDKLEIRQAFAYAIDRERVTKVSYAQIGKPVVHMADYSDDRLKNFLTDDQIKSFNTYAYDRKKADELMQKAGYKKSGDFYADASGKTLELELSAPADFTDWMPAAQDVVDQLNDFGVKVTLRAVPNSQHAPDVRAGKFQLAIRLWGYPNPLPWYAFRYLYQQNAVAKADADPGMSYPLKKTIGGKEYDFVSLIGKVAEGTDPKPQNDAFFALTTAFNQDLPTIPLVERFYNTPLVTTNITAPPVSDPIWGNVSGSDNAIVVLLMSGGITPKAK
jgi:peptide/nickel transport system substrate-binding protein